MSELARRRDARDLWISRSHVLAAGLGVGLGLIVAFASGYLVGRSGVGASESPRYASLVGETPGTELVELLAEVERARVVHASSAIEYPAWAQDEERLALPEADAAAPSAVRAVVPVPPLAALPPVDPAPEGTWTVGVGHFLDEAEARAVQGHLVAAGHAAWVSLRLQDGVPLLGVAVGGFDDETEAAAAAEALAAVVVDTPGALETPTVVAIETW